ncbi:meiotic recombination protein REC8 homolog isoform X11 [Gallus gallus]|uniref:meiotic recombination protein REC8 homolog isoform X11 n=1 Tax=Gallus gallus TaxID=9031 RepID=UPI001AE2692E|nr:meiotic recombination protein REC8 homolog isoform X11 [Gallus gallus]
MFYHPEILQRRSGCFGTIWLAATCVSRLQRREVMAVDVPRTCSALAAFVQGLALPRSLAPPLPAEAPPLRCSLYLAALLQLGLTRVYWRQCGALAEEVAAVWGRLHRLHPPPTIDLSPTARLQLLPDAQCAMAALEFAPDPFFGLMEGGAAQPHTAAADPGGAALPWRRSCPNRPRRSCSSSVRPNRSCCPTWRRSRRRRRRWGALQWAARPPRPPPTAAPLQIPAAQFRAQLRPTVHCGPMIIPELHPEWRRTPMELFRTPAVGWLPPELWDLWVRAARPIAPEPSEVEELREVPEPSVGLLPSSELTLEVTPEELRPLVTPAEEWRAPPPLPELPEEAVLPPVGVASMRRAALEGAARPEGAELHGLLPSSAPRKLWARLFRVCLDLCAAGWLRLEQSRPFGPIGIRLGPRGPAHPSPSPARAE